MPSALITGITGQDGSYLAEYLLDLGYDVAGLIRRSREEGLGRVEHLRDRVRLLQGDLLDQASLVTALQAVEPDDRRSRAARRAVAWPVRGRVEEHGQVDVGAPCKGVPELDDVRLVAGQPASDDVGVEGHAQGARGAR